MSFTELHYLKTCLGCIQEAGEGTTGYRMRRWHSNASSGFLLIQGAEHGGHCPGTLACRYHSIVLPLTCLDAMLLREGRGWRAFRTGCLQGHPMQSRLLCLPQPPLLTPPTKWELRRTHPGLKSPPVWTNVS